MTKTLGNQRKKKFFFFVFHSNCFDTEKKEEKTFLVCNQQQCKFSLMNNKPQQHFQCAYLSATAAEC
jgi:GTP-dependent phosphoenolpyruvate carboxykinase